MAVEDQVRDDIVNGLRSLLTPDDRPEKFRQDLMPGEPITNGRVTAVIWEYESEAFEFGKTVTVSGATFAEQVGDDADDPQSWLFRRYIDWVGVMAQLGFSASWRPLIDPIPAE